MAGIFVDMALKHRKLAFKTQHGGGDERLFQQMAGIAQQKSGGEIIGAIADDIVLRDQGFRDRRIHPHGVNLNPGLRVERPQRLGRALRLVLTNPRGGMGNLPLQVGQFQPVMIHQPNAAHPRRRQIQRQRRAQAPRPHHQHPRRPQPGLAYSADLTEQDVAGVAVEFSLGEIEIHAPVEPNPPVPREVSGSTTTSSNTARTTGASTACATRMPRSTTKSSAPVLSKITPTSPR